MDQPFAGLAQEMFERQKYPDAVLNGNTGKPVNLPYDVTGWTLPLQFGVKAALADASAAMSNRADRAR